MKKKWKEKERLVAFIESQINKGSKVEHDIHLPDLTGASESRQCDIVIRSGYPPRETITLVEVQDRSKQFDITFFDGLVTKMKKVGAQHLICVSNKDFPASIVNTVSKMGDSIRLVKFEETFEFEKYKIPFFFENSIQINNRNIIAIDDCMVGFEKGVMPQQYYNKPTLSNDDVFFIENDKFNISKLILLYIDTFNITLHQGLNTIDIDFSKCNKVIQLYIAELDKQFNVKLNLKAKIDNKIDKIPIIYSAYKQHDFDDPLALLVDAKGIYNNENISIQFILTLTDNNLYKMAIYKIPDSLSNHRLILHELLD